MGHFVWSRWTDPLRHCGLNMPSLPWFDIEPGDIGFDGGVGLFGWLIRRSTGAYGHTWVYHEKNADGSWTTVEAGVSGIKVRVRTREANKVYRPWRNEIERKNILASSNACVGRKYGWGEIGRIALHLVGIKINGWKDNKGRMICSNHVSHSISSMRRGVAATFPYKPNHIWPQKLAEWCDWYDWTRQRIKEKKQEDRRGCL